MPKQLSQEQAVEVTTRIFEIMGQCHELKAEVIDFADDLRKMGIDDPRVFALLTSVELKLERIAG